MKKEREPQTDAMSVGSAFDAYVKSHLFKLLLGPGHPLAPKFERDAIFEQQVEPHNRDFARKAGAHCFLIYQKVGALADLLLDMQKAVSEPRFEIEVRSEVTYGDRTVTFLGKPDIYYMNADGHPVLIDWKVNGYCSKWPKSPSKGYIRLLTTEGNKGCHKHADLSTYRGMLINQNIFLHQVDASWADQISIYSWICGSTVGEETIAGIDQLVCNGGGDGTLPSIKVAEHRCRIDSEQQVKLFNDAADLWDIVHSDHYFRDMPLDDSIGRCKMLNERCKTNESVWDLLS